MIFGRPTNLILGAFTTIFNVIVLGVSAQGVEISPALIAAINIAFAALIALIANQPPTVKAGGEVNIQTPSGEANRTTTVG